MFKNKMEGYVQIVSGFAFGLFLIGCVYVPSIGKISEETLATIKMGITTKDEIIQQFGEPFILKEKKFFIYEKSKGFGDFIVLPIYPGTGAWFSLKTKSYRILLEFNGNDIVKRCETEEGNPSIVGGAMPVRKSKTKHTCLRPVFEERSKLRLF